MPDSDTAALARIVANTRRMGPELRRQWVRRVLACSDLTATQKNVLVALETYADWDDGTNAHPGETNLSEHCDIGTRAVRAALARGRELRLIERTAAENPRAGLAAVYRLVFDEPETGATEPESDPTTGTASPVNNSTTGTASPVNNSTTGLATSPSPAQPCLPPSQSPNSFGLRNSGTSPAPVEMTQNPPAPSPYCELHPQGTQGGCWGCKRAGAAFRAWQAEQAVIDVAIADAARREHEQLRLGCPRCGGTSWITDDDGEPIEKCDHQPPPRGRGPLSLVPPLPDAHDDVRAAQ